MWCGVVWWIPFGPEILFHPVSTTRQKSSLLIWRQAAATNIHRNPIEFWRVDLIMMTIADWHDIESYVAFEVHVRRFKSKEVGIKKLHSQFFAPKVLSSKNVTHNINIYATRGLKASTPGSEPSTLGEARSALCSRQGAAL